MKVFPHDQFVVRIDGSQRLTCTNTRFLWLFNPVETKFFNVWLKNVPSSPKGNVRYQHVDSHVEVTEDSYGANTDETREIYR